MNSTEDLLTDKWSKLELQVNSRDIKHKRHLTGVKSNLAGPMMEENTACSYT